MIKTLFTIAIGILGVASSNVTAQTKADLAEVSCGDLLQMSTEEYIVIGAWMSGYYNAKHNNTLIDIRQLAINSKTVIDLCRKEPKITVMKAIEQLSKAKN